MIGAHLPRPGFSNLPGVLWFGIREFCHQSDKHRAPSDMKSIAPLFALFFLGTLATGCAAETGGKGLSPVPDRPPAPEFELEGPDGTPYRLSDFRGMPLIVNFWATWCPPCRAEMPSMQRAWEQVKDEGIALIAVNVGEDVAAITKFAAEYPVKFPLPMDLESRTVQAWTVRGLPTTYVVDPQGRLAYVAAGEREWDDPKLLDLVRELKSEPNTP